MTEKTAAVIITSPVNPTGTIHSEEVLRAIGKICLKNKICIITDDPYSWLCYDGGKAFNLTSVPELKEL